MVKKKWFSLTLISMLVIGLLAACGTSNDKENASEGNAGGKEEKKVLTMGTSADYPPFEYIDTAKGDEIIGFDADLAKAITKELGYEVKIVDMDFNGLIPAIQAGKVDFVMAGMTPTPEREKSVDFSEPYYITKNLIVIKKDSGIKTVEDLKGKTVGVQVGTIQEEKANEIKKTVDMKVENRNRIPEIIQEMNSNRFDAAIIEDVVAKNYFAKDKNLTGFEVPDAAKKGSAVAFPNDSKLKADFDRVLNEMKESGELDKLIEKWFSGEQPAK
ncbi:transporter substrate-binding domain-containing protein [Bacillus songklensis]|uniref:Transporter substrate-binding domain-containing protein n=1 Tax=Bacillus songklensis TaxID=1069116 RepID=A0ABV8B2L1_9BACI